MHKGHFGLGFKANNFAKHSWQSEWPHGKAVGLSMVVRLCNKKKTVETDGKSWHEKSLSNLRILKGPERRIRSQFYIWAPLVAACRVQHIFNKKKKNLTDHIQQFKRVSGAVVHSK